MAQTGQQAGRQCFPCKACCAGWLITEVLGNGLMPGRPCPHVTGEGCGIYEKRPEDPCRLFRCAWLKEERLLPAHMIPSECGAIVLLDRDWNGRKVIRAIPTGEKIPAETLEWLMGFAREQSLPMVFNEFIRRKGKFVGIKKIGYGPSWFVKEVAALAGSEEVMLR